MSVIRSKTKIGLTALLAVMVGLLVGVTSAGADPVTTGPINYPCHDDRANVDGGPQFLNDYFSVPLASTALGFPISASNVDFVHFAFNSGDCKYVLQGHSFIRSGAAWFTNYAGSGNPLVYPSGYTPSASEPIDDFVNKYAPKKK